jgi:predicted ATPase
MSLITLRAKNFRKLERFEWSPSGVCLLSGPNGAGKTTAIDLLRFLRATLISGHTSGFYTVGGDHLISRSAGSTELVELEVIVGDVRWRLMLPMSNAGLKGHFGEELYHGDQLVLRAAAFEETWTWGARTMPLDDTRCCAKVVWDRGEAPWMEPLYRALYDLRTYDLYINQVRLGTTREERNAFLHGHGQNLWAVLANWQQAPRRYVGKFDWVMERARQAFPDLIETMEFDRGEAFIYPPGATDPADGLPPRRQADGLLTGLCQLTAVAGALPWSILAFDEIENQLHPHAIRVLLAAMREQAEANHLTILLTTHSPIVMNEFSSTPDHVFVLDPDMAQKPVALDQLKNPDWLAMFSLGDLYDRMKFAAPSPLAPPQQGGGEGGAR